MSDFYGLPTAVLENKHVRLEYLISCGPRIVRFSDRDGTNLFAELPEFNVQTLLGQFNFNGGHRLWCSPEIMSDTYFPDDEGLIVENLENSVRLIQHAQTGITKSMEARLSPDLALVNLTHRIYNNGSLPVNLFP
jgi:hypothetical protein